MGGHARKTFIQESSSCGTILLGFAVEGDTDSGAGWPQVNLVTLSEYLDCESEKTVLHARGGSARIAVKMMNVVSPKADEMIGVDISDLNYFVGDLNNPPFVVLVW